MSAEEAGGVTAEVLLPAARGLSAEVDPPLDKIPRGYVPNRPDGGVTAGAEDNGGIATVALAGLAPSHKIAAPHDGCAPPADGGLPAVAKPREHCPLAVV